MRRFIYWLRRKWRIQEKRCGQCCLTCPYYEECSGEKQNGVLPYKKMIYMAKQKL